MNTGTEWIIDVAGGRAEALADLRLLREICDEVIAAVGLLVVGEPAWHQFPEPGGVTGLYLLSESHLCCHTWPEHGTATFNLFCCRPRPAFDWPTLLIAALDATHVRVRTVGRRIETDGVAGGRGRSDESRPALPVFAGEEKAI